MKALVAAALLVMLGACGMNGADNTVQPAPRASQALPPAPPPPPMPEEGGACAADVKQCPDGSFVSRIPAKGCTFAPCPGENQ
jgi:hypothetical protein